MAEEIASLDCDNDSEITFDEELLQWLCKEWDLPFQYTFHEAIQAILNNLSSYFHKNARVLPLASWSVDQEGKHFIERQH